MKNEPTRTHKKLKLVSYPWILVSAQFQAIYINQEIKRERKMIEVFGCVYQIVGRGGGEGGGVSHVTSNTNTTASNHKKIASRCQM